MSKKSARDMLFKLVFELGFHKPEESNMYENFLNENDLESENLEYVKRSYTKIVESYEELKDVIKNNTESFAIERIFKVDLAILIVAVYELMYEKETPVEVIANEAVELAKKYSTDKSYVFINGVISNIIKTVRK